MQVFDRRRCMLGEGPLWHPERQQLFWFDILGKQLLTPGAAWDFEGHVSAAGWVDRDRLLIASETALSLFNLVDGGLDEVVPLEADMPETRSNDGRADPYGGFWIGTMGKGLQPKLGAIYRYYRGELRKLYPEISIPNSISFSPDGLWVYFTDTPTRQIMRSALDESGWPKETPEVYLDLRADGLNPDGSVVDAEGRLWNAQWGAGRVACYKDGALVEAIKVPASQTTCPAFGGDDLGTLYITSAAENVEEPEGGMTFAASAPAPGQKEHRVLL